MLIGSRTSLGASLAGAVPCGTGRVCVSCGLGSFLVFTVHRHALARKDVCERAFVPKLAVSFDEPRTHFFLLPGF